MGWSTHISFICIQKHQYQKSKFFKSIAKLKVITYLGECLHFFTNGLVGTKTKKASIGRVPPSINSYSAARLSDKLSILTIAIHKAISKANTTNTSKVPT